MAENPETKESSTVAAAAPAVAAAKPAVAKPAAPKVAKEPASSDSKSLVVKNAVGEYIRAKGLKVSSDLYEEDGFNGVLKGILDAACKRCENNGRKTVMKQDL